MEAEWAAAWAAVGACVIALGSMVVAIFGVRDGRRHARESAAEAEGAIAAADLAAASAKRAADALEEQAKRFNPDWELARRDFGVSLLRNRNGEAALNVEIRVGRPWYFFDPADDESTLRVMRYERLESGSSKEILVGSDGSDEELSGDLEVTWQRPNATAAVRERWSVPVQSLFR